MTVFRGSTLRARALGGELRNARERAGFSANHMAHHLGWSTSKLSRMETGERGCTKIDAAIHLAFCRVQGRERNRILELAELPEIGHWLQHTGEPMPDTLKSLIMLEQTAETIHVYETEVIPGLAQTEGYIRSLFHAGGLVAREGFDARVYTRLQRQRILTGPKAPAFTFYIHEKAVATQVGTYLTMHEQLLSLLLLGTLPNVRLRLVPAAVAAKMGPTGFNFFSHQDHLPVVSVDLLTTTLFLDSKEKVDLYSHVLTSLDAFALDEGESRSLLATLASDYERLGREQHAVAKEHL